MEDWELESFPSRCSTAGHGTADASRRFPRSAAKRIQYAKNACCSARIYRVDKTIITEESREAQVSAFLPSSGTKENLVEINVEANGSESKLHVEFSSAIHQVKVLDFAGHGQKPNGVDITQNMEYLTLGLVLVAVTAEEGFTARLLLLRTKKLLDPFHMAESSEVRESDSNRPKG